MAIDSTPAGPPRKPTRVELAAELDELRERLEALEGGSRGPSRAVSVIDLVPALREVVANESDTGDPRGAVVYAGVGRRGDDEIAWQMGRRAAGVLAADGARSARILAALANPARLDVVRELLAGPLDRRTLQRRLHGSTAGQLNHQLRELLGAGLVAQPRRGVYEVPRRQVVPILALLSCAADLAGAPPAQPDREPPDA